MNARDALELAGFAVTIGTIIFHVGRTSEQFAQQKKQTKEWADGLGGKLRSDEGQSERRWKHEIADRVEELEPKDKALRVAARIRRDA